MSRYLTPTKLRELLPGTWINDSIAKERQADGSYAPVTDAQIEPIIEAAEQEADSYVGVLYALPLPVVPAMLSQVVADICRYRICANSDAQIIRERYQDCIAWLSKVASGKASLGIPSTSTQAAPASALVRTRKGRSDIRARMIGWGF